MRVEVTAPETAGLEGWTIQATATAYDSTGVAVPDARFTWASTDSLRATVDWTGLITIGTEYGGTTITAVEDSSRLADSLYVRLASEGQVRWAVRTAYRPQITGGPTIGPDGTIWVLTQGRVLTTDPEQSVLVHLSPAGATLCSVLLKLVDDNLVAVPPEGDWVWVTGATVYRVGRDCAVLQSVNPYGIASLSYGAVGGDGTLFMPESDALIAYTPALMERWRKPRTVWWTGWLGPPTVAGERLYAKVCADSLYALDAATGGVIWSQPSPDTGADVRVFATGPVPIGARVYLPGRVTFTAYDTAGTKLWQSPDNGTGISEPVVTADGRLFVQLQQSMVAWDESGNELWRSPYGATRFFGLAGGPALAEGGLVYIAGAKGFYALDLDGNVVWGTNAVAGDSAWFAGSPAIGPDGMIYTWGETHVYALFGTHRRDPTSPWPMWRHDAQRTGRVP